MSLSENHLTDIIKLLDEIKAISDTIAQTYREVESGDQLNAGISEVIAIMGRTPRIEAEAEYLLNKAKGHWAVELKKDSATVFRERLAGETATEQKLYKFAYRLNTHLPEILGALRSQLSYVREQIPKKIDNEIKDEMNKLKKEIEKMKETLDKKL